MQNFDTSNQASPSVKVDSAGNSYIYNAIYTGVRANIVKYDPNGNQLWAIQMVDSLLEGGIFYSPLSIAVDNQQNVYGFTTEISYTGFDIKATNGSFHLGPSIYNSDQQLIAFKLDKNGNFLWSSAIGCVSGNVGGIVYDRYTNMIYPLGSYTTYVRNADGTIALNSLATQNADILPTSFFWSIDANTGKTGNLKNLYIGSSGTLVPLPDRLSYYIIPSSVAPTGGSYFQLDHTGSIIKNTLSEIFGVYYGSQSTNSSSAYYFDTGITGNLGILGYYDFRSSIRKFDLAGNLANEVDYSMFDTLKQQKVPVLSIGGIKSLNSRNVLFYGANLQDFKTYFLGDSLAKYDFRLVFMDDKFNVNQNIKCSSTSYLTINSFDYNQSDNTFMMLLSGNQQNTIKIGSALINVPPHDFNVNYTYLVKIKFDNVALIPDSQPAIVSMLYDQQAQVASINDTTATVTSIAQPGTDLSSLSPTFILSGGSHFKTPLTSTLDLSKPLTVAVVNSAGTEKDWTINVIKTYNKNNIDTVSFINQLSYNRDTINKAITVLVDRQDNLHSLSFTTFKADSFTTVSPSPASIKDFSTPQVFSVKADNGDVAQWTITVNRKLSSANDILALQLAGQIDTAHINDINKIITLRSNTLNTSIKTITLSDGATLISPLSNTIDFSNPVTFEVQAENGDIANWTVNVTALPFSGLSFINVYPMPAVNDLNVALNVQPNSVTAVNFSSIYGQTLLAKKIATNNSTSFIINVSEFPPGIYLLNVTVAGQVYTKKIIVKH
jgi:hypothetical protein